MHRPAHPSLPLLFISLAPLYAQPWRDPSPHTVQMVTADKNLRLEVLDWGGSGKPLVLLAGGGDSAHVFDDFAPKLLREMKAFLSNLP